MSTIVSIITVLAAVSLPVMYLAEKKYGYGRWAKIIHTLCVVSGVLIIVADSLLCYRLASTLRTPGVGAWAKDFYFGYLWMMLPALLVITALIAASAAIEHPMKRIRIALSVLIPVAVILITLFVSALASGGKFPVDMYIRWLAPGLGLLPHVVPLCERRKKSD